MAASGERLISVHPKDLPRLAELLSHKLALLGRAAAASASGGEAAGDRTDPTPAPPLKR